jgi:hypothetical protein
MVCFRYIIVNTVHEGDNRDDNNNSIYFNWHLLTCRLYVSIKTQINHKTNSTTNNMAKENNIKEVLGQKA